MSFIFSSSSAPAKDQKDDKKSSLPCADTKTVAILKNHMSRLKTNSMVRARLVGGYAIAGTSGGSTYQTQALSPIGVQDWSSYAALYDLARCTRVKFHICPAPSAAPTIVNSSLAIWAAAWDPSNLAAYSSTGDMLTAQHFIGPIQYNVPQSTTLTMTKTGFHTMSVNLPTPKEQIANNNASAGVAGGGWIATSDTNYIIGWLKTYQGQLGTGITPNLTVYVWYDMEFKSRT
jgi:hypothetical protein